MTDAFPLRAGEVRGARHVPLAQLVEVGGLEGTRAFLASAHDAAVRLRALPAVREATVEVHLAGTYAIALVERQAIGRWQVGGVEWFIDADGVLFASADPTAAPALRVSDERVPVRSAGDRLEPAIVQASLRLAALAPGELRRDMTAPSVRIERGANGIVLESGGRWEVRFGDASAFNEKLTVARKFLQDNSERALDYVDVRSPERVVFSPQ